MSIPLAIAEYHKDKAPVAQSILARSLLRELNQFTQNIIELLEPVESVAITRLPSFHAPDTAEPNK